MAAQQSNSNQNSSRARCSRWLLLLLCVATWRGPIPCLHAHAGHAAHRTHLGHHLEMYHSGRVAGTLRWHFHFLLPWQKFDCYDCEDDPESPIDPLMHDGALVLASDAYGILTALSCEHETATSMDDVQMSWCVRVLSAGGDTSRTYSSFVESLWLSVPVRAVTGVALC
jgi:hypothetical protein